MLASDVDNPLLGRTGAAAVYGPQKGASPQDVAALETGLRRLSEVLGAGLGDGARRGAELPGAGAAGVPVVAVTGRSTLGAAQLAGAGITAAHALPDIEPDVERCIAEAGPLLEELVVRRAGSWGYDVTPWCRCSSPAAACGAANVNHTIALELVAEGGVSVPGELDLVDLDVIRDRFIPAEPAELELGVIELNDGSSALAVVVRQGIDRSVFTDISDAGGWRAHMGLDVPP